MSNGDVKTLFHIVDERTVGTDARLVPYFHVISNEQIDQLEREKNTFLPRRGRRNVRFYFVERLIDLVDAGQRFAELRRRARRFKLEIVDLKRRFFRFIVSRVRRGKRTHVTFQFRSNERRGTFLGESIALRPLALVKKQVNEKTERETLDRTNDKLRRCFYPMIKVRRKRNQ